MRKMSVLGLLGVLSLAWLGLPSWTRPVLQAPVEQEASELALRMVLVRTRSEAEEIFKRLEAGEPFEKLAREHSLHPTAKDGGYMGRMNLSALRPELREALKGLTPGLVTKPVETPSGYVILKVLSESEGIGIDTGATEELAFSATGQDREALSVSGFLTVNYYFQRFPKPPGFYEELATVCETKQIG